eukprot:6477623-Amphidinium_carterae.1
MAILLPGLRGNEGNGFGSVVWSLLLLFFFFRTCTWWTDSGRGKSPTVYAIANTISTSLYHGMRQEEAKPLSTLKTGSNLDYFHDERGSKLSTQLIPFFTTHAHMLARSVVSRLLWKRRLSTAKRTSLSRNIASSHLTPSYQSGAEPLDEHVGAPMKHAAFMELISPSLRTTPP